MLNYMIEIGNNFDENDEQREVLICNDADLEILISNLNKNKYRIIAMHLIEEPLSFNVQDFISYNPDIEFGSPEKNN